MKPRYVLASVTGWNITPSGATTGYPRTIWTILDSGWCYRQASESRWGDHGRQELMCRAERMNRGVRRACA